MKNKIVLTFVWHCYQPPIISDSEVQEIVDDSYFNILSLHKKLQIPLAINIQGCLLKRLTLLNSSFISFCKDLLDTGELQLLSSAYYHPILPLIHPEDARLQIEMNRAVIEETFGMRPSIFYPPELAWSPWLLKILYENKFSWTLIGSPTYIDSQGINPLISFAEIYSSYIMHMGQYRLGIYICDCESSELIRKALTTDKQNSLDSVKSLLAKARGNPYPHAILWGDGEMITSACLKTYEQILLHFKKIEGVSFKLMEENLEDQKETDTRFIISGTRKHGYEPWVASSENITYLRLLANIRMKYEIVKSHVRTQRYIRNLNEIHDLILAAESSCFLFWKYVPRFSTAGYEYIFKAQTLLEQIEEKING
jgi:hypothetical protein